MKYNYQARQYRLSKGMSWGRWHELIDIRSTREFTPAEKREYRKYETIVKKQDREEAEKCKPYLNRLLEKQRRAISSIEKLTEAVKKAAEGK